MSIRTLSGTIAILLTANVAAADARPSDNVRYYGGTRSTGRGSIGSGTTGASGGSKTATTNSSVINASQQYKVFYQYYVHYFNWYSKRTRNQEQCRKLATLAAVRQLSIEKATANSRATAPVQVATSLKLPGVALANSLDREEQPTSPPLGVIANKGAADTAVTQNDVSVPPENSSASGNAGVPPAESSNANAPGSAGFQPAPKRAQRQTNSKSRPAEHDESPAALRGPLPVAKAKESKFHSRIQEELENTTGLRGPLPLSRSASAARSASEQPGSRRSPDLVDLVTAQQSRPTEFGGSSPDQRGSLPPTDTTSTSASALASASASPMMHIAAAVSQQTKPNKKWWQLQLRKDNSTEQEPTTAPKRSKLTNIPTSATRESKLINFPLIAQTAATPTTPPPTVATGLTNRTDITPNSPTVAPSETRSTSAPLTGGITKKTELSQVITSAPFELAWAKERYAEAKVFAAELAKSMPDSKYYAARYYVCCIQTADWPNAYSALERLVSLDQLHKYIYACDYGRILFELHKYEPAKAKLKEALAFGNDSEPVHRTLLLIAIAQKDDAAAIGEYKHIARLCPRDYDSRIELAELLWKGNKKDEAVKVYDQVAAMIPDNADIQSKAGYANLVQGNYKAAMNAYKLASDSSTQQKYKNAQEFAEAQFVTVQKMASTAKASSQD